MATYAELADITNDAQWGDFLSKVRVACIIKAQGIIDSTTPAATLLDWAQAAIASPETAADGIAFYVVAKNNGLTLAQIYGASDNAIQTNVDSAVDAVYGA